MNNYINILKKTFKEFLSLTKAYGFKFAFFNLVWWINFYIYSPFRFKLSGWALKHKTKFLTNFIENNYDNIIKRYREKSDVAKIAPTESKIWVFWGQGEEKMPVLVKSCYDHLCSNNDNVILVTAENYHQYAEIPEKILNKCKRGDLSWAHFSDILRNTLLYQHGGLWLDATVWTSGKIPYKRFEELTFFSPGSKNHKPNKKAIYFWTSFRYSWSSWCMWTSSAGLSLFGFVSDIMKETALQEKVWPDYVFQDFLYYYAIQNISGVSELFKKNSMIECKERNRLATLMNHAYDNKIYRDLCKEDFVFKLSFRSPWKSKTNTGEETFYGKLICSKS